MNVSDLPDKFRMEFKDFSLFAMVILLLDIFNVHFGDGAVALFLSSTDYNGYSTDLDASGNYEDGSIVLQLFSNSLDRLINIDIVLAFDHPQFHLLLGHELYFGLYIMPWYQERITQTFN